MSQARTGNRQSGSRGGSGRGRDPKPPWGNAFAVIDREGEDEDAKADWLALGGVWESEKGALSFTLRVEPLAWRNPAFPRRVVIVRRDEDEGGHGR